MPFKLPEFTSDYLHAIVACGSVQTKSKKVLDMLRSEDRTLYSAYDAGNGDRNWLVVILGGGEEGNHFHIESVSQSLAVKRRYASPNVGVDNLQALIRPMLGKRIDVTVAGLFLLPINSLPKDSFIRPLFFQRKRQSLRVRTESMSFEIEGALVPRLTWFQVEHGKTLQVELSTRLLGKIDEDYLTRFASLMNATFSAYVFGTTPHVDRD